MRYSAEDEAKNASVITLNSEELSKYLKIYYYTLDRQKLSCLGMLAVLVAASDRLDRWVKYPSRLDIVSLGPENVRFILASVR